jgi:hypothetical protein
LNLWRCRIAIIFGHIKFRPSPFWPEFLNQNHSLTQKHSLLDLHFIFGYNVFLSPLLVTKGICSCPELGSSPTLLADEALAQK